MTLLVLFCAFAIRAWWLCRLGDAPDEASRCVWTFYSALPWVLLVDLLPRGLDDGDFRLILASGTLINVVVLAILAGAAHGRVRREFPVIPRDDALEVSH